MSYYCCYFFEGWRTVVIFTIVLIIRTIIVIVTITVTVTVIAIVIVIIVATYSYIMIVVGFIVTAVTFSVATKECAQSVRQDTQAGSQAVGVMLREKGRSKLCMYMEDSQN